MSLKQWFRAFLMGASLVWLIQKLYSAYLSGQLNGRYGTHYSAKADPFAFDIMFAVYTVLTLIVIGTIVLTLWRAGKR